MDKRERIREIRKKKRFSHALGCEVDIVEKS